MEQSLAQKAPKVDEEIQRIKDLGRTLTEEEMYGVIEHAETIRRLEELRESRESLAPLTKSLEGKISIPAVYEIGDEIGIPQRYMEQALKTRCPSIEQQLADLEEHGAVPSIDTIYPTYQKNLLNTLQINVPSSKFRSKKTEKWGGETDIEFFKITKKEVKKGLFKRKKILEESVCLAKLEFMSDKHENISYGKFQLEVIAEDPIFLQICGKTLKKLNENFKKNLHGYFVKHKYHVKE